MAKMTKKPQKSYSKPTLTRYGTIQELTGTVGPMKALDGGAILGMRHTAV